MVAWRYLDKQAATIRALADYENMACILELSQSYISDVQESITSTPSIQWNGVPGNRDLRGYENKIINGIHRINVLKQRYKAAQEFMEWFAPAWNALTSEEQLILSELYMGKSCKTDAIENLSEQLFVARAQVYRRKDKALERLTLLLYGE